MKLLFYLLAGVFLVLWFLGYIIYSWGPGVHLFFILAVAILVAVLYQDNKT